MPALGITKRLTMNTDCEKTSPAEGAGERTGEEDILDSPEIRLLVGKDYPAYRKAFGKKYCFNLSAFLLGYWFGLWNLWRGMWLPPLLYGAAIAACDVLVFLVIAAVRLASGIDVFAGDGDIYWYAAYAVAFVFWIPYGFIANRLYKCHLIKVYQKAMGLAPEKRAPYLKNQRRNVFIVVSLAFVVLASSALWASVLYVRGHIVE